MLLPVVAGACQDPCVASIFLHNASFTREADARDYTRDLPRYAADAWYWNIWRIRQRPFAELHDGVLVGLVVAHGGRRNLAYLAQAHNVLATTVAGWDAATKAIAKHSGLPLRTVRSDEHTADKRADNGGHVIAWQARDLRPVGVDLPGEVRMGRNGWAVLDSETVAGWLVLDPEDDTTTTRRPSGAGFLADAEARRTIEMHAVKTVLAWCERAGWQDAEHVGHDGESFDIRGTVDSVERRIEVKGTTGSGESVTVTFNEVEEARDDKHMLLAVVHGITLDLGPGGDLLASGGTLTMHDPWLPVHDELRPISYRWRRR